MVCICLEPKEAINYTSDALCNHADANSKHIQNLLLEYNTILTIIRHLTWDLLSIAAHTIIRLAKVHTTHETKKLLIVRDDNKLEITLRPSMTHKAGQTLG